ncbi:hypothetical protein MAR_016566 [Mya arenaria]|uniref:DUF4371 domain-containing protein n=1 Tax=Mya arenaria TaxID=6604 RepID=A0ABY7FM04_MYAAR|nr:hypothetical protein MAR_016566 [Mya arenaria]
MNTEIAEVHQCTEDIAALKLDVTQQEANDIFDNTKLQAKLDRWFEVRKKRLTASRMYESGCVINPNFPWPAASPDGIMLHDDVGYALIEISLNMVIWADITAPCDNKGQTGKKCCHGYSQVQGNLESENANAIKTILANEVEKFEPKLTGFSSDGSSVMTGKVGGVAALLRRDHPSMIRGRQIALLAEHFFPDDTEKAKLKVQWNGFKYHTHDILLPNMREEVRDGKARMTPTEWLLLQLLRSGGLRHFNPELINRLSGGMLKGLLHVGINGPEVDHSQPIIKKAVNTCLEKRPRRKIRNSKGKKQKCYSLCVNQCQCRDGSFTPCTEDIRAVLKEILVEEKFDGYSSDDDADNNSDCDSF